MPEPGFLSVLYFPFSFEKAENFFNKSICANQKYDTIRVSIERRTASQEAVFFYLDLPPI